jgi:hypothetical protein
MNSLPSINIPGMQMWTTPPVTHTITYITGPRTYTEPFVCMQCPSAWVETVGGSIAGVMAELDSVLSAIPVVGSAIAGLVNLSTAWYGYASLNSDGSVTLEFAQHYAGTKAGGVDLTAWPVPGVDPNAWAAVLNALRAAAQEFNRIRSGSFQSASVEERPAFAVTPKMIEGSKPR